MSPNGTSWWPVAAPLGFAAGAATLTRFVTDRPEEAAAMARGIAGPVTWPTIMLYAVLLFSLAWGVQRVAMVLRSREQPVDTVPPAGTSGVRVWLGIALVLGYGYSLALLGFAISTALYMLLWLVLGGIRKPLTLVLVPMLGTTVMMYFFIKLALMPLDRGVGAIGEFSIALYRLLGIY